MNSIFSREDIKFFNIFGEEEGDERGAFLFDSKFSALKELLDPISDI